MTDRNRVAACRTHPNQRIWVDPAPGGARVHGSFHRRRPYVPSVDRFPRSGVILVLTFLVRCYQAVVRPLLGGSCKFVPSCSEYAIDALCVHGILRGLRLTVGRLARCHPFHRGGFDPVPPTSKPCKGGGLV